MVFQGGCVKSSLSRLTNETGEARLGWHYIQWTLTFAVLECEVPRLHTVTSLWCSTHSTSARPGPVWGQTVNTMDLPYQLSKLSKLPSFFSESKYDAACTCPDLVSWEFSKTTFSTTQYFNKHFPTSLLERRFKKSFRHSCDLPTTDWTPEQELFWHTDTNNTRAARKEPGFCRHTSTPRTTTDRTSKHWPGPADPHTNHTSTSRPTHKNSARTLPRTETSHVMNTWIAPRVQWWNSVSVRFLIITRHETVIFFFRHFFFFPHSTVCNFTNLQIELFVFHHTDTIHTSSKMLTRSV